MYNRHIFQNCKISIIVPVFNTGQYLVQCLNSLINQTLKEIEIICVNDGSTDNSLEILQEFAKNDARIKIVTQKNQGQSISRNNAMELAKGEYLGFLDSDDWAQPDMFEKLYNNAKKFDSDIAICDIQMFDERTNTYYTDKNYKNLNVFDKSFDDRSFKIEDTFEFIFQICVVPWNKIYRRNCLKENKIKFIEQLNYEDNVFTLETMLSAQSISLIREPLVIYRATSQTSYSRSNTQDEKKLDFFKIVKLQEKILKTKGVYKKLERSFRSHKKSVLKHWCRQIKNKKIKLIYMIKLLFER